MNTIQHLQNQGWKEYPNRFKPHARCFYKRYNTPTRCSCNDDKEGMQVCVNYYKHDDNESFEIELCGEANDGTWLELKNYSLSSDIEKAIAVIPRLLATWETFANYKPTEQ
jgi:hypothetical protein